MFFSFKKVGNYPRKLKTHAHNLNRLLLLLLLLSALKLLLLSAQSRTHLLLPNHSALRQP